MNAFLPPPRPPWHRRRQMAALTRRSSIAAGLCLCCMPRRLRADVPLRCVEVAPGLFMRRGVDEDASAANGDAIANTGFIVGADGVLVTDPGGCLADGAALRQAVRAVTPKPIRYVLLSHVHPDHVFGAGAFSQDNPVFLGHANLPQAMAANGPFYQAALDRILGPGRAGPIVPPTQSITSETRIDLGQRILTLRAHAPAHTSTDVSLFDHATRTLLPADLLFVGRAPSLDGSVVGWIAQLRGLAALKPARAVPGHGPVSVDFAAGSAPLLRYLSALRDGTRAAIRANTPIGEASTQVAQGERAEWALFDEYNPRNVLTAYKELEWE